MEGIQAGIMDTNETKFANECRIGMKWRLKEEDLRNMQSGSSVESKIIKANIPGVQYYLKLHPNGKSKRSRPRVAVYMHLKFKHTKSINATFTISVKSASKILNFQDKVYEKSTGLGEIFCTNVELFDPEKKYLVNGFMEIELDGTLKPQGLKRKAAKPLSLGALFWEDEDDKDITIVVKENEIKIHKLVLCASSSVFKAELNSGMKEAIEKKINIIEFSFDTVKIAVEFFYERNIKDLITEENASELLHFADKYDVASLHRFVQTILIEKLSEENVVKFANASVTSNAHDLREFCVCFLINAAKEVTIIGDIEDLKDEITSEIGRRSFLSAS